MFLKFFVPPATPLPPPALEMDTQDAGVTVVCSVVKLKLLKFDARSHYFERASYFAKLSLVSTEFFLFAFCHILSNCSQVLFLSIPCEMVYVKGSVPNDLFVQRSCGEIQ